MNNIAYFGFFAIALKMTGTVSISWFYIAIPFLLVFLEPLVVWVYNKLLLFSILRTNKRMFEIHLETKEA